MDALLVDNMHDAFCDQDVVDDSLGAVDKDFAILANDVHVLRDESWQGDVAEWIKVGHDVRDDVVAHDIAKLSLRHGIEYRTNSFKRCIAGNKKGQSGLWKLRTQIGCCCERALGSRQAQRRKSVRDIRWNGEKGVDDVKNASLKFQILTRYQ